ncbi:MAG: D-alanyl-D-alanine carboxypeptidase family protein [Ruminococcus flavefaciens]|nr:D-alanyl-D-alanine carboxypeptidase family protein [Ruminococcus flavefaciens]MCM1061284.1 D-alanyl-D-alanine carboxypeptidase family protein [Eubacterium sp.]
MSKISKIISSAAVAVILSSITLTSNADSSLKGDINGDNVIGGGDMKLLQSYILKDKALSQEEFERADINCDGSVDSFDLVLAKKNLYSHLDKLPMGTWIADGKEGTRYYNFTNGTVTEQATGKTTVYSCDVNSHNLNFSENVFADKKHAIFSYSDETHLVLRWDGGAVETLHYYGEKPIDYSKLIRAGKWTTSGGYGSREFNFSGVSGNYISSETGMGLAFEYSINGNKLAFQMGGDGNSVTATMTSVDSTHFTLTWEDGMTENFTRQNTTDYTKLIGSGKWLASGDNDYRVFSFNGTTGNYIDSKTGIGLAFEYSADEENLTFHIGSSDNTTTAVISSTDSTHFTLTWENGAVENFIRQNIEVKNGVTYVNGILIANKTYSLPSSYNPGALTAETQAAFNRMKNDAAAAGLNLWVCSGFRSYSYQDQLYNSYVARDGKTAADTYSARAGHSEHQTGLALDINMASDAFIGTPEAKWIAANCYKYGFILRYPQGKQNITGYKYEPWHVRYLGTETAKAVYDSGLTLEEYLGIDSVYQN